RIAPETRASLESVGLRTAGAVMAAPRAPLARRFGATLLLRLDQALGRIDEAVSPRLPVAPLSVERHLAEPVVLTDDIERLVSRLAVALKTDLERRGEGARALALLLFRVDGAVSRVTVGTSRPLREPTLIRRLFHERLAALEQDIDAGFGFDLVRLSVLSVAAFDMLQGDLTGEMVDDDADIALFADRIRARLGDAAVLKPVVVESHLPERAVTTVPFAEAPQRRMPATGRAAPPMTIYPPERPVRL
ncbi:DNA polymerase Y family protein, partial [Mesorhizobium sp. M1E.F.Ca.ET.063.01.1.1]